jgi:hypothetical protein
MTSNTNSTRQFRCPNCDALHYNIPRSGVVHFEQPVASSVVITKLVALGYLRPEARHRSGAIKRAIGKLRGDLIRAGVIL